MEGVNIWWYNIQTLRGGADIWCCNILKEVKIKCHNIFTPMWGVKISCCNIITPLGRNIMARVNILYLNIHPGVLILYNKFTLGCSYYITSPPGSETLGEWKYYLTPARTLLTLHPSSPPTVLYLFCLSVPVHQLPWQALQELNASTYKQ